MWIVLHTFIRPVYRGSCAQCDNSNWINFYHSAETDHLPPYASSFSPSCAHFDFILCIKMLDKCEPKHATKTTTKEKINRFAGKMSRHFFFHLFHGISNSGHNSCASFVKWNEIFLWNNISFLSLSLVTEVWLIWYHIGLYHMSGFCFIWFHATNYLSSAIHSWIQRKRLGTMKFVITHWLSNTYTRAQAQNITYVVAVAFCSVTRIRYKINFIVRTSPTATQHRRPAGICCLFFSVHSTVNYSNNNRIIYFQFHRIIAPRRFVTCALHD